MYTLDSNEKTIKAVMFDFGGVLAEEGFREGIMAFARKEGFDAAAVFKAAEEKIYETGYVTGRGTEGEFWDALREKTGLSLSDERMRAEVMEKFRLRPDVLALVEEVHAAGYVTGILSDQTDWLDVLEARNPFYQLFDYVFNSFKEGKGKRDATFFEDVCARMGLEPEEVLFVDDKLENIKRAEDKGLVGLRFCGAEDFEHKLRERLGLGQGAESTAGQKELSLWEKIKAMAAKGR